MRINRKINRKMNRKMNRKNEMKLFFIARKKEYKNAVQIVGLD